MPPRLLVLTDRHQAARAGRSLVATLADAADGGPVDVVLREKDLPRHERARLATDLADRLRPRGGRVLVASDAPMAHHVGADGVHLAEADPWPDLPLDVVGRSCHQPADLEAAAAHGATYATYSPVFVTASKPGYGPVVGLDGLARACRRAKLAVVALGGIDPSSTAACRAAGAVGVAVMGAVMAAADPAGVVAGILAALAGPTGLVDAAGTALGDADARAAERSA